MKSLLSLGLLAFALTFCNLGDRIKQMSGSADSERAGNSASSSDDVETGNALSEKPDLTAQQQSIVDGADEVKWNEQGILWKLPAGWKKMDVKKETFNYSSPDMAFLLVNISPMSADFPADVSTKAYYDQAMEQLRNGKYESVRYLEIDGVKGVEWVEAMPEDKSGARRHQWMAYRNYLGQQQLLNVMLSTKGTNFEKQRDVFPAIMYSMIIPNA